MHEQEMDINKVKVKVVDRKIAFARVVDRCFLFLPFRVKLVGKLENIYMYILVTVL